MISFRGKWIAAAVTILLLTVLIAAEVLGAGAGAEKPEEPGTYRCVGGVSMGMPDDSVKLFLEGYFGIETEEYESFPDFESARMALDCGRVSAIWAADVTAEYLEQLGGYRSAGPTETPGKGKDRFSFAFAFRKEDAALRDRADAFLAEYRAGEAKSTAGSGGKPLYIGVTGAVPPLEFTDGDVSGSAVELARAWAESIGRTPEFVKLEPETAYIRLMAGGVDMLAVSATSENHSLTVPKYITSTGYLGVKEYRLVTRKEGAKSMNGLTDMIRDNLISGGAYRKILSAAAVTVGTVLIAFLTAALFGLLLLRLCACKNRIVRGIAAGAAYILRSVPALLLILLLGFGVFGGLHIPMVIPAALGIGLFGAGLLTEHGISKAGSTNASVDAEQFSFRDTIAGFGSRSARKIAVTILQWSTVVSCLGINDIAGTMQTIGRRTMFPVFSVVCSIAAYLVLVILIEHIPCTDGKVKE